MALDAQMYAQYQQDGIGVFRVYQWQSPAFTYGVAQSPEEGVAVNRCLDGGVAFVKRITGGGTLFHDDELTYSFVCSKEDVREPEHIFVSYRTICAFLIRFYVSLGLQASFALEDPDFKNKCAPKQLCSASFEKYDIVINGKKIGGNAQRRRKQMIFQHGSIPWRVDWKFVRQFALSLPEAISSQVTTLSEELPSVPDKAILQQKLIDAFAEEFGVCFIEEKEPVLNEASLAR